MEFFRCCESPQTQMTVPLQHWPVTPDSAYGRMWWHSWNIHLYSELSTLQHQTTIHKSQLLEIFPSRYKGHEQRKSCLKRTDWYFCPTENALYLVETGLFLGWFSLCCRKLGKSSFICKSFTLLFSHLAFLSSLFFERLNTWQTSITKYTTDFQQDGQYPTPSQATA